MLVKAIQELLSGDATVNTMTGGRIRPLVGAQLDARPFLVFSVAGGQGSGHMGGKTAYQQTTVEIGIYADTYLACEQLSAEARRVLDYVRATTSTCRIAPSIFDDHSDIEQQTPPGQSAAVFVRTQTYRVNYKDL